MPVQRIKALLLDLDDTLLINDMDVFLPRYFQALVAKVQDTLPAARFVQALREATRAMAGNDGQNGTNQEVFEAIFYPRMQRTPEELQPLFDSFYSEDFETLQRYTSVDPHARRLVELAFSRGYQVAIATQPLFPQMAIWARLRWADVGAEEFPYGFITSYETMRACKPHPHYFESLIRHLGREPQECLMVGDSTEADMLAGELGIHTFWVRREAWAQPVRRTWDAEGNLADLITLIQTGGIDDL